MKNKIFTNKVKCLAALSMLIAGRNAIAQTHLIYKSTVQNESTMYNDVINFDVVNPATQATENRTFMVGKRSLSAAMSTGSSAFIKCVAPGGAVIWQQEMNPTVDNQNCEYYKVIRANNGDLITVGYMNNGTNNTANTHAVISVYDELTGNLISSRNFFTNSKNQSFGDMFFDVVQDPNNDNIYVCGGNNMSPGYANSIIASLNFNTLATNWFREYVRPGDAQNTNSDVFTTLDWFNNTLYVFGYFQGVTDYDLTYASINPANGNVINQMSTDFQFTNNGNRVDDCVWPKELYVDRSSGTFLLSGQLGNNFTFSTSNTHFVMRGSFATPTFTITDLNEYHNTDPTRSFENNIEIEPISINNGDFILIQSPSTINAFSTTNFSTSNANMESNITRIHNMNTQLWTREIAMAGRQWFSGASFNPTGNNIFIAGSSLNSLVQVPGVRDAYLFFSPTNIPVVEGNCSIISRNIVITAMVPSTVALNFTPVNRTPTSIGFQFGIPNLRPVTLCTPVEPCNSNFKYTYSINTSQPNSYDATLELISYKPGSTYIVNWGDGTSSTIPPFSGNVVFIKTYAPGSYTLCVTEIMDDGTICKTCINICISKQQVISTGNSDDPLHEGEGSGAPAGFNQNRENDDSDETSGAEIQSLLKNGISDKLQVYPNPTSDKAKLEFSIETATQISIKIFDFMGKEVINIPGKKYDAGNQSVLLDTRELITGMYTIIVNMGGKEVATKLLIIK